MIPRPRQMDDGSLMYPKRGQPPPEMEGFVRDPGDPFILRPNYPDCESRRKDEIKRPCNRSITGFRLEVVLTCDKGYRVSHSECRNCIAIGRNLKPSN